MTDPVRRELLELLDELSRVCPEVRFGQLVTNLSFKCRGLKTDSVWESEDAELLTAAKEHLAELEAAGVVTEITEATS